MKIGWFTPLHRQSAIGNFSATVCAELAKHHAVTIYASDISDGAIGIRIEVDIFAGALVADRDFVVRWPRRVL